jgi:hypothetical protein
VNLDESLYVSDDIEDDLESILFNLVASTVSKRRTFQLLWWVQLLNCWVDLDEILYGSDEVDSILLILVASTIPKW